MRRAVCPGSYDPVTNGHVDVVARAATLFDEIVVAVLYNPAKRGTFAIEERLRLLEESLAAVPNLRVEAFADRLLVDVCRDLGASAIVKGLRGGTDFAYELPMARMNKQLTGIETVRRTTGLARRPCRDAQQVRRSHMHPTGRGAAST